MKRTRRNFTGKEKVALLRRHLVEQAPVSQYVRGRGGPAHAVLPVAEAVRREWRGGVRFEGQAEGEPGRDALGGPGGKAAPQGRGAVRADGGVCRAKKRAWGVLNGAWVPHDTRNAVVDFVTDWSVNLG